MDASKSMQAVLASIDSALPVVHRTITLIDDEDDNNGIITSTNSQPHVASVVAAAAKGVTADAAYDPAASALPRKDIFMVAARRRLENDSKSLERLPNGATTVCFHPPLLQALDRVYSTIPLTPLPIMQSPTLQHELMRRLPWTLIEIAAALARRAHQQALEAQDRGVFTEASNATRARSQLTVEAGRAFPIRYIAESLAHELLTCGICVARPVIKPPAGNAHAAPLAVWQRVHWEPLYTADGRTRNHQLKRGLQDLSRRLQGGPHGAGSHSSALPPSIANLSAHGPSQAKINGVASESKEVGRATRPAPPQHQQLAHPKKTAANQTAPASSFRLDLRTGQLCDNTGLHQMSDGAANDAHLAQLTTQKAVRRKDQQSASSHSGSAYGSHAATDRRPSSDDTGAHRPSSFALAASHNSLGPSTENLPLMLDMNHQQTGTILSEESFRPHSADQLPQHHTNQGQSAGSQLLDFTHIAHAAVAALQQQDETRPGSAPAVALRRVPRSAFDLASDPERRAKPPPGPKPPTPPTAAQLKEKSISQLLLAREKARQAAEMQRPVEHQVPSASAHFDEREALAADLLARRQRQREDVGDLDPILQAQSRAVSDTGRSQHLDDRGSKPGGGRGRGLADGGRTPAVKHGSDHRPAAADAPAGPSRYLKSHTAPRDQQLAAYVAENSAPLLSELRPMEPRPAMPQVSDRQPASTLTVELAPPLYLEIDPLVDPQEWSRMDGPLALNEALANVYAMLTEDYNLDNLVAPAPPAPPALLSLDGATTVPVPDQLHALLEEPFDVSAALQLYTVAGDPNRPPAVISAPLWKAAAVVARNAELAAANAATSKLEGGARRGSANLAPITERSTTPIMEDSSARRASNGGNDYDIADPRRRSSGQLGRLVGAGAVGLGGGRINDLPALPFYSYAEMPPIVLHAHPSEKEKSRQAREYANWVKWWKMTLDVKDYKEFINAHESDFLTTILHLVDPLAYERHHRKEAVDTGIDPRAVLIAEASEKMRQQRSQYAKGLWNVAVVDVGGLAADIEDLAAVRLEGADETLAITSRDKILRELTARLDTAFTMLQIPSASKVERSVRYGSEESNSQLEKAVTLWEAVAAAVTSRETCVLALERFERHASDPRRFFDGQAATRLAYEERQRQSLLQALKRATLEAETHISKIETELNDVVEFAGRNYRTKMRADVQEMLYWLQQERREKALQAAASSSSDNKNSTALLQLAGRSR